MEINGIKVTHYAESAHWNVTTCTECDKPRVKRLQTYHLGFGKRYTDWKEKNKADGIEFLPTFDEVCECAEFADEDDE